jgi:murein DD-endopeptidase MepM/ murein hydrolase activator NlpD
MCNPLQTMQIRQCKMSNTFGLVRHEYTGRSCHQKPHQGWDLAAPVPTPVYAIRDGRIVDVQQIDRGGYGKSITLEFQHVGQTAYAFYAHLSKIVKAKGDVVKEGVKGPAGSPG